MPLFLFICSQFTYKRFLLFWALTGMLFTHSWLTEPYNTPFAHQFAQKGTILLGILGGAGFIISFLLNKRTLKVDVSRYTIGIGLCLLSASVSIIINPSKIEVFQMLQLAIPLLFGLSFIYAFSEKELNTILMAMTFFGLINLLFVFIIFILSQYGIGTPFPLSGLITDRNGLSKYVSIFNVYLIIEFLLQKKPINRSLFGLAIIATFLGVLIVCSRSGYIVYIISVSLTAFLCGSKKMKNIFLIVFPFMMVLFGMFTYSRVHSEKMQIANMSDIGRIYVAKAGINMIKTHPVTGIGYRQSLLQIQEYADKNIPGLYNVLAIHNWFIDVWAEQGVLGLILFCGLNGGLIIATFKRFKKTGVVQGKYALFSFVALIITMVDGLVLPNYDYESLYWLTLAIAIISLKKPETGTSMVATSPLSNSVNT